MLFDIDGLLFFQTNVKKLFIINADNQKLIEIKIVLR